jgi:glycyl-tRNA synthetase beta subunit
VLDAVKSFKCLHCERIYESSRALGGHSSKQHKGMSAAYNRKIQVRDKRASHRVALGLAKQLFERHSESSLTKERSMVTLIRNVILKTRPEALNQDYNTVKEPVEGWFVELVAELLDGLHGRG